MNLIIFWECDITTQLRVKEIGLTVLVTLEPEVYLELGRCSCHDSSGTLQQQPCSLGDRPQDLQKAVPMAGVPQKKKHVKDYSFRWYL